MADVAQLAGVSHQTVSRVLSGHPNVRPATRENVLAAMARLGYRRNASARALVTRRTRNLGVVACDTTLYGPASTLFSLEEAARAEGYFVSTVGLRRLSRDSLAEALEHLSQGGVEGVVVIAPQSAAVAAAAELPQPFPVVTVEGGHEQEVAGVSVDQALGARLATEHLLASGHATVWHVAGPSDWLEAEARRTGWREALEAAGAPVPEPLSGDWTPQSGYHAGQRLAGLTRTSALPGGRGGVGAQPLTAVFVANDQMALGVLRAFREAGVRVPEDVAVVGFDDIPEAEYFAPPLTTVRQDFAAVGRHAIRLLLERIEGGARPDRPTPHVVIEPQLIVRGSSAPAHRAS